MKKEVYFEDIGLVKIVKKRGLKRMTLSVKAQGQISMSVPYSVAFSTAEKFIEEKKNWIIKSQKKIKAKEDKRTVFAPGTEFATKYRRMVFIQDQKSFIRTTQKHIEIHYTTSVNFEDEGIQEFIRKALNEILRAEAKKYLPERTRCLAEKHNFSYEKLSVRNAKTRWGSCSGRNNISLNIHLMRLPDKLIDYVILHELCHTVEKNHGKNFWALLDKVSGNAKALDKALKEYNTVIF